MADHHTRRAILSATIAVPLVVTCVPTSAAAAESPTLMDDWRRARELDRRLYGDPRPEDEALVVSELFAVEDHILKAQIRSRDDAIAKLCVAGLSLERGFRCDESDATAAAIAYLEAL